MSTWLRKISLVSLGWIALTCAAAAQTSEHYQDMPLGDIWITSGETGAHLRMSIDDTATPESDVLAGDVWIAADDLLGAPASPHAQAAKNVMTGSFNERPIEP